MLPCYRSMVELPGPARAAVQVLPGGGAMLRCLQQPTGHHLGDATTVAWLHRRLHTRPLNCCCRCAAGEESDDEQLHMQQQEQLLEDVLEDEQQVVTPVGWLVVSWPVAE